MKRIVFIPSILLFLFIVFTTQNTESSEETISLRFIQPAGESPRVFTEGWVFGAGCIIPSSAGNNKDLSSEIHWSGTGKFYPEYGPETHPVFDEAGENKITAEISINGKTFSKTLTVITVLPDLYACVGDWSHCSADNHGCPECPHDVIGRIASGSPTVKVRGKPAARIGDGGMHGACCGDNKFTIIEGDESVMIDGKPAARIGGATQHCGGAGIIVVEDIHKINESTTPKKNTVKEINTENVYFPLEYVPQSKIDNLEKLKHQERAEKLLKMEGPDYSTSAMDVFSEVSDIFGLQSATISLIKEVCELDCLDKISTSCGRIGILFSAVEIINNVYEGKKIDAFYNTLKASGYFALDYGWSSLKIASFAIVILDYTLKRFMKEMIDSHYDEYKRGFYNYFNNEPDVKRDFKFWKTKLNELYAKSNNDNEKFQSLIDEELSNYFSSFWNPEVYIRYLPGFKGDLRPDEKKMLEDSYKKEVLSPVFNAIFIGMMENEKRIVDKEIKQETEKLVQQYNSKINFIIKVNGPANKINKVPVKIGEWIGNTDSKGYWIFDATFYAYLKNKSPIIAEFTVAPKDVREVTFKVKNKTEITFDFPKPVSIDLNVTLSKDTEDAGFSAMATSSNFDQNTIKSETGPVAIEWKWKINDNIVSSEEGGIETKSHMISGILEDAKVYTFTVELVNKTEGSTGFNNTIATATKTVTIKKDRNKEKEIEITKKEEEIKKKEEEKKEVEKKEVEPYYEHTIPMNGGYANYNYKKEYTIQVFVQVGDRAKFSDGIFKWKIKEGWEKVVSEFSGQASFIFPYHNGGFYVIECSNSTGTVTFSKPLRLE